MVKNIIALVKRTINIKMVPKFLYKYQKFDPSYFQDIVINHRLHFSDGSQLNDPFDCRTPLIFVSKEQDRFQFYDNILKKHRPNMNIAERKNYLQSNWKELDPTQNKTLANELILEFERETLEKNTIACFTTKNDDILMWSHYADSHKGVCYGFKVAKENIFYHAIKVEYSRKREKMPFFADDVKKYIFGTFLTKAKKYRYENEYRIINFGECEGHREFDKTALTSIVFGCMTSDKIISEAKIIIKQSKLDIALYRAYKDDSFYKLNIKTL